MNPEREYQDPTRGFFTRRMVIVHAAFMAAIGVGMAAWAILTF
jgi:hypothetical protein